MKKIMYTTAIVVFMLHAKTTTAQTEFLNSERAIRSMNKGNNGNTPTYPTYTYSVVITEPEKGISNKSASSFSNDKAFESFIDLLNKDLASKLEQLNTDIDNLQTGTKDFYNGVLFEDGGIGFNNTQAIEFTRKMEADSVKLKAAQVLQTELKEWKGKLDFAVKNKAVRDAIKTDIIVLANSYEGKISSAKKDLDTVAKNMENFNTELQKLLKKQEEESKKEEEEKKKNALYQASASPSFLTNINSSGAFSFSPTINVLGSRVVNDERRGSVNTIYLFTSTTLSDSALSIANPSYWIPNASSFGITYKHTEGWKSTGKSKSVSKKSISINAEGSFLMKQLRGNPQVQEKAINDSVLIDVNNAVVNARVGFEYFPASNKWVSVYANFNMQWAITQVAKLKELGGFTENVPFFYFDIGTRLPMTVNDQKNGFTEILVDLNLTYITDRMKKVTPTEDVFIPTISVGVRQNFGLSKK